MGVKIRGRVSKYFVILSHTAKRGVKNDEK
jgi:hypothetical protein